MSTDTANAPLIVIVGRGADDFYINPLDTVSDSTTGIISPEVLKRIANSEGEQSIEQYVSGSCLRPAYKTVLVSVGLNEHAIGIRRINSGVSYLSFDVTMLYRHRMMDYAIMVLNLIAEHTGRPLEVYLVIENWQLPEVIQLRGCYPDIVTVEKFEDLTPLLYDREHQAPVTQS